MEELRKNIAKNINESNLSLECVYYILKDIFRDVEGEYIKFIQQQEAMKKQEKENKMIDKLTKSNLHVIKNEEKGE